MMKLKSKAGFTLMEMMVSISVTVLLIMGIGTSMDSGMQIYKTSMFESNSGTLSAIINTSLGDILRYAEDIKETEDELQDKGIGFTFTNPEYGVVDAYFYTGEVDSPAGVLQLKHRDGVVDLVNKGAYPDLEVTNFKITYTAPGAKITPEGGGTEVTMRGGYFYITYDIHSKVDASASRPVKTIVRLLNTK